ncbi:uncharacterized protein J4E92_005530 [Alternaria infectoria]|uniref:uncharacterized protein n=1 Tax=Alternaria infectoria TaxID=45303 RepID=UPI0022209A96|nr:uncharacterized protein J4E92_005530 [Alternaria infectoria]KAI4928048.1 hypothetical protein J4E92_005530 [Alternaria infectoria]
MNAPPIPPEQLDCYEILGVNERAVYATIERCYKRLQAAFHPDSRRVGATPSTEHSQNIGAAWDTLKDTSARRRYDRDYIRIRREWDVYRIRLGAWEAEQREKARRQARAIERQRKVADEEARLEKEKLKALKERAAEATRRHAERVEAEELRLREQEKQEEIIRRRENEAQSARERLQEEKRRQGIARAKEEARIKADWERAQREKNLTKGAGVSQRAPDERDELRERWRHAKDRTTEQAHAAGRMNDAAAKERLRKQKEEIPQPNEDNHRRHAEPPQEGTQETERLARKQREADERQAKVIANAQKRQEEAAKERLRREQLHSTSLKRPASDDVEDAQDMADTKKPKVQEPMTSGLRKHMAREQARRVHTQKLQEVGGPGNEERLRDVSIDLGWKHVDYQNKACPQCHTKKSAAQFGLWECPEGGALRCRPCLAALSVFSA